jgi:hypothetical protein
VAHVRDVEGVEPGERERVGLPRAGERRRDLPDGRRVPAVSVDDDDALPAVAREAGRRLADVRAERVRRDPQRPGELAVLGGDADRDRRRDGHRRVAGLGARRRDGAGAQGVGPEWRVRAVLLGAADGQQRRVRVQGVGVGPRRRGEVHGDGSRRADL